MHHEDILIHAAAARTSLKRLEQLASSPGKLDDRNAGEAAALLWHASLHLREADRLLQERRRALPNQLMTPAGSSPDE
jgi:hypothetical protein